MCSSRTESPDSSRIREELRRKEILRPQWCGRGPGEAETSLSAGALVRSVFPDPENLLETAENDLRDFLRESGIPEKDNFIFLLEKCETECREAYTLKTENRVCRISANDTEGIRRGIYEMRDTLLSAEGPFLKLGIRHRKPWMKTRISRCFFGPTNRPPRQIDELADEVDYYPEAYLSRLAAEGVNGLWITVEFSDICRTFLFSPADSEKRIAKLRRVVEKCRRFGIAIYLFSMEPNGLASDSPVLRKYPELDGGTTGKGVHYFCPSSETAWNYLYQCTNFLFSQVPFLGGIINLGLGERFTSCVNQRHPDLGGRIVCPRCRDAEPWRILNRSLEPMEQGMHDAAPNAELISWLYMPEETPEIRQWVLDLAAHHPKKTVLLYNFESGIQTEQAGKLRCGGDYWQSQPGPAEPFRKMAAQARENGVGMGAKIQTACSHELATVPEIPVPGLLYDKYREMRRLCVTHVMQCWYFGNYPGLMSRTAGRLAFHDFSTDKTDFLLETARRDWHGNAEAAVRAWEHFEKGYRNYPLSKLFQYYGPVHDGIVWPLYPRYAGLPLSPTWLLWEPSGDAIGECLHKFTLDEAEFLCGRMAEEWNTGVRILSGAAPRGCDPARERDLGLARAVGLLFSAAHDIFLFYRLRASGLAGADSSAREKMRTVILRQIEDTERMKELCLSDPRLGYHSEAEGYKFHPALLERRLAELGSVLEKDNPEFFPETVPGNTELSEKTFRYRVERTDSGRIRIDFECSPFPRLSSEAEADEISIMASVPLCTAFPSVLVLNRNGVVPGTSAGRVSVEMRSLPSGWGGTAEIDFPDHGLFHIQRGIFAGGKRIFDSWREPPHFFQFERGYFHPRLMRKLIV